MSNSLRSVLANSRWAADTRQQLQIRISDELIGLSKSMKEANFRQLGELDLHNLWRLYDTYFFDGALRDSLSAPLELRLSRRMSSSAGMTIRRTKRRFGIASHRYEIAISTTLLFQTFADVDRVVTVAGVECKNRVEALQRTFEHELIHLAEMLEWQKSSCSEARFQELAARFFGHREHTHKLITSRERAASKFGVRVGDPVRFRFDGQHLRGRVNRITRRATVIVEHPDGRMYSDGHRYMKYYIPVAQLTRDV